MDIIKDYFDLRLAEFNASNGSYLVEVSTKLNNPPAGQRQRNYTVTLSGFEEGQRQSEMYSVEGEVELTFNLINKAVPAYWVLQQYVYNLARYIRRKHQYSVNNKKWNVREISGSDLDNILNDKLVCKLEFTGDFYETNAVTITAPSTPTLSTPANAGTGTVDQSFNWTAVSGATSYTFEISDPTGILFTQAGLSVSSFTIPADSLLTAGTVYQWRVKAVGEGGSSAWTDYFSFTAESAGLPEVPSLTSPLGTTDNDLNVTFVWALSANSTSYDFQIASDSGFTTLLRDINVTATTSDYTFSTNGTYYWRVRGVNGTGNSAWADSTVVILQFAYEQQTTDLVARFAVAPDATRKGHMNTLIKGLKDANIWDRLDVLQMYQSHSITSNDWGLNWRKNAYNATGQGAVGLTIDAPVTTTGSVYIKTGFIPSTDGIAYTKDRASVGIKMLNESSSAGYDIGLSSLVATGYNRIQFRNGSNQYVIRLNTVAGSVLIGSNSVSKAFHILTRSSSTTVSYYKDATLVVAGTGQDAGATPSTEIYVGAGESGNYRAGSWGSFFAGTHLTATDITNLVTLVNAYYTNIGAQV